MKPKKSEIIIDESKLKEAPTFFQRIKHVLMSVVMAIVFAQVMLFAFRMGPVVFYFMVYTKLATAYVAICAVLGWFYGEKFIQTLGKKSEPWWNLWNQW